MELLAQTNLLRLEFLSAELELSFTFAQIADFEFASGDRQHAEQALRDASKGCQTVRRFLADPKHSDHLTPDQIGGLNQKLAHLRERIDRLGSSAAGD